MSSLVQPTSWTLLTGETGAHEVIGKAQMFLEHHHHHHHHHCSAPSRNDFLRQGLKHAVCKDDLKFSPSCLHLQRVGIIGMHYPARLGQC